MTCPVCKSKIVEVRIPTFGVKGNSHIDHYECSGCFIMFAEKRTVKTLSGTTIIKNRIA